MVCNSPGSGISSAADVLPGRRLSWASPHRPPIKKATIPRNTLESDIAELLVFDRWSVPHEVVIDKAAVDHRWGFWVANSHLVGAK